MGAQDFISVFFGLMAGVLTAIVYSQYGIVVEETVHIEPVNLDLVESVEREYSVGGNSYYFKIPVEEFEPVGDDVQALSGFLNQHAKENTFDPQLNASMLSDKVRILCYVITPRQNVGNNGKAIVKSWAYHCNELVLLSSIKNKDLETKNIKMPDGKKDAWSRAKVAMKYVHDNFIDDYDWFVKLEQDSVVVAENIRYMVLMHQANIPGYAGQVLSGEKTTGSVHILSKQALRKIAPKLPECPDTLGGMADDLELDECLSVAGMSSSTDGRDQEGVWRFQIVMPEHKLPANTKGYIVWYWRYVRKPELKDPECCSDYAISFHEVSANAMYLLEFMIYHMKPFGVGYYTMDTHLSEVEKLMAATESGKLAAGNAGEKGRR